MEKLTFKNVMIGFGKAGRVLAKDLSRQGETVAVIERDPKMYGGTCPNVGCIPSKSLITSGEYGFDFAEAMKRKYKVVDFIHNGAYHNTADEPNVTVLDGVASFVSAHELEIAQPDGTTLNVAGERIFINTGATPVIPEIDGIHSSKNVITSREAMELDKLPERLVIIGAGYVGLEFAHMFRQFGSKVTILEPFEQFLPREDDDVAAAVLSDLTNAGIDIHLGTAIEKVSDDSVLAGGQVYPADKILVATGRKPNIDDLNLSKAGVELAPNGYIKVDDYLQTTVENIWALGDVRGGGQFYYLSTDDYRIVKNQLLGDGTRKLSDRTTYVPYSVFTEPTLSRVGLSEKEAKAAGVSYRLFKMSAMPIAKARIYEDTRGLLKALVDPKTDEILGVTLYYRDSQEVINLAALAMKMHTPYQVLREQIFTHPTMTEALNDLFANEVK